MQYVPARDIAKWSYIADLHQNSAPWRRTKGITCFKNLLLCGLETEHFLKFLIILPLEIFAKPYHFLTSKENDHSLGILECDRKRISDKWRCCYWFTSEKWYSLPSLLNNVFFMQNR